jgi:hypothetical protein
MMVMDERKRRQNLHDPINSCVMSWSESRTRAKCYRAPQYIIDQVNLNVSKEEDSLIWRDASLVLYLTTVKKLKVSG